MFRRLFRAHPLVSILMSFSLLFGLACLADAVTGYTVFNRAVNNVPQTASHKPAMPHESIPSPSVKPEAPQEQPVRHDTPSATSSPKPKATTSASSLLLQTSQAKAQARFDAFCHKAQDIAKTDKAYAPAYTSDVEFNCDMANMELNDTFGATQYSDLTAGYLLKCRQFLSEITANVTLSAMERHVTLGSVAFACNDRIAYDHLVATGADTLPAKELWYANRPENLKP
jgi:hypothetical protein